MPYPDRVKRVIKRARRAVVLVDHLSEQIAPFAAVEISLIDDIEFEHQEIPVAVRIVR